ncbi:Fur family transcriptional regulator [Ahrensia marina]|jgi:Fur family zinc uptake transcriptional regulator|uniref:Fur family transcriptional regulator n=1 Tax=Ahrensia marina TaxID=1514904 RepID=A0A0M9GPC8_9HYPH|nr:Fur family transcriptional regulator [Ahrensia marina]KPB02687.1 Fur family transcriptional regulator [Ahrensia marina]
MSAHSHTHSDLTKNQSLVMDALSSSEGPLSAYTILDQLRDNGMRAPLQVYRALDKLVEYGLVHRLESLNAFVACRHPNCDSNKTIIFMICEACDKVNEITDAALAKNINKIAASEKFALNKSTVELRGLCPACQTD